MNIFGHNGLHGCPRCTVKGVHVNHRTSFLDANAPLRTDESFRNQEDEEHHHGESVLCKLNTFNPVSNVPFDYMHLVLLGVFRTLVYMLLSGPKCVRQSGACFARISEYLVNVASWVPCDFVRKTRSLLFVKRFKAT